MKVFNILFFISLISLGFISCNEEHDFLSTVTPVSGSAKLKVIHAAPDTTGVTLKIDNNIVSGVNTILSATVPIRQSLLSVRFSLGRVFYSKSK
ncbi:MAG: hypothetical protein IPK25_16250 [Saprospiraceae bacterium]|nr:hypothetical protein [Saprospiraceae bacterium]